MPDIAEFRKFGDRQGMAGTACRGLGPDRKRCLDCGWNVALGRTSRREIPGKDRETNDRRRE